MRMWKVNPKVMCRQHLLGEHLEMHMFKGCWEKGKSVSGYIEKGLVEMTEVKNRHDELVIEMSRRSYNHKSPMEIFLRNVSFYDGQVDEKANLIELAKRCPECKKRIEEGNK